MGKSRDIDRGSRDALLLSIGLPRGTSTAEAIDMLHSRSRCTRGEIQRELERIRLTVLPVAVEFGAFVRPLTPKTFWARLWERIGHWLIRKAGYEQVYP